MRDLDRTLSTPHHLAVFEGGHVWLSSELATQAVEWMEVQAMKSGIRSRDDALLDAILARRAETASSLGPRETYEALRTLVVDFAGL